MRCLRNAGDEFLAQYYVEWNRKAKCVSRASPCRRKTPSFAPPTTLLRSSSSSNNYLCLLRPYPLHPHQIQKSVFSPVPAWFSLPLASFRGPAILDTGCASGGRRGRCCCGGEEGGTVWLWWLLVEKRRGMWMGMGMRRKWKTGGKLERN